MFALGLEFLTTGLGFPIPLLPSVATFLQILEPAFEQLELILALLALLLPIVTAHLEERDQFPQGTSELGIRHDSTPSMKLCQIQHTSQNGTKSSIPENTNSKQNQTD
jgi:hypothetical protein